MTFALAFPTWFRRARSPRRPTHELFDLSAGQRLELTLEPSDRVYICAGEAALMRPRKWVGDIEVTQSARGMREGDAWTSVERESVTLVGITSSRFVLTSDER